MLKIRMIIGLALSISSFVQAEPVKIMTFNTFLLAQPPATIGPLTMGDRVDLMLKGKLFNDADVIVLNEAFTLHDTNRLLDGLSQQGYRWQTPVLSRAFTPVEKECNDNQCWNAKKNNWSPLQLENGGVAIVSRHKILRREQMIFHNKGCGFDAVAAKGAVYARIALNGSGEIIHVFGTHTQAVDSLCSQGSDAWYRIAQFEEIRNWVLEKHIPADERVFIAGDLNVNKGSDEYRQMLQHLHVVEPRYEGADSTWDPQTNKLTGWSWPGSKGEYLDYVLSFKDNVDAGITLRALQPSSAPDFFHYSAANFAEYSDHYPVVAYTPGAEAVPAFKAKDSARYQNVVLKSQLDGRYIAGSSGEYLTLTADKSQAHRFSLYEWIDTGKELWPSSCLLPNPGTYLKIKSAGSNNFWEMWRPNGVYYLDSKSASYDLYLSAVDKTHRGCLELGDVVSLSDMRISTLTHYYLQVDSSNRVSLSGRMLSDAPQQQQQFTLEVAQ